MSVFKKDPYMPMMIKRPHGDDRFALLSCKIELELLEASNARDVLHSMLETALKDYWMEQRKNDKLNNL